ncbi:HAD family phosphatase [Bacillus sp. NTK071]|uniref:Cof-type HAD-IIB family hydrolase n=1 Tax=Bacillus sp. NTK071 TaxID=2802175 RepID=UPI001A8CAF9C|nr:Cof-type HAD-IIB family hydrolase [Bacillus sp. NTK071]MBN8209219.1 HAD family phosphatase [Bacillus sp. NTK071]
MRCISIDMDGTLLTNEQTISSENVNAIREAQSQDITVVLNTGRAYDGALKPLEGTGLTLPIICYNGAEIRSTEGEIQHAIYLDDQQVRSVKDILDEEGIYYQLFTNKGVFTHDYDGTIELIIDMMRSSNPNLTEEEMKVGAERQFESLSLKTVDNFNELIEDNELHVYKFLSFSSDKERLNRASAKANDIKQTVVTSSGKENLEINHENAQKGLALETFVADQGLNMKHTAAIGDNYNDLSMLRKAAYSIAMGNADQEIKNSVAFVTKSNEEDGVAHAIYKIMDEDLLSN